MVWERDASGEYPDEDEGSATITDGSTSYTITGLEEDSSYTITVTANNAAGSAASEPVNANTKIKVILVVFYSVLPLHVTCVHMQLLC